MVPCMACFELHTHTYWGRGLCPYFKRKKGMEMLREMKEKSNIPIRFWEKCVIFQKFQQEMASVNCHFNTKQKKTCHGSRILLLRLHLIMTMRV